MSDRQAKRAQFHKQSSTKRPLMTAVFVAAVLVLAALGYYLAVPLNSAGGRLVTAGDDGRILIALEDVSDGQAHFYRYQGRAGEIRFFVLKSDDGVIRAAFDACDVCYREGKGYRQEGVEMVCIACGQRFASSRINEVKGGCNPAPLQRAVQGDRLHIRVADLEEGSWFFPVSRS